MVKRTNRAAWGLAVLLAMLLLGGGGLLGTHYWKRLSPGTARIIWLPPNARGFERTLVTLLPGNHPTEEWQSLGFVMACVK